MKCAKIFIGLILILMGCSKNSSEPIINEEISYDVNTVHHDFKGEQTVQNGGVGVWAIKYKGIPGGIAAFYSIAANAGIDDLIQILIPSDSLTQQTYHLVQGTGSNMSINQDAYGFLESDDYLDVTITDYNKGIVNGSFSGKMSKIVSINPTVLEPATITNGEIKNVLMHY